MTAQQELLSLDEPLLNAEEAARLLNVRPSWVRDATRAGKLPCLRVGRHLRYTQDMLEQWAATQRTTAARAARPRRLS